MSTYEIVRMILSFSVAFVFSLAATPLVIKLAPMMGAIDVPLDNRRMHKKPIPRIGGLAIFFGCLISILCFAKMDRAMISVLAGVVILIITGIIDDTHGLQAKVKLVFQILAACVVVVFGNIRIGIFTNPNIFSDKAFLILSSWLSIPLTIIWIVLMINSVNFIDGLDGLAAGVSTIASVSLVFICLKLGKPDIALVAFAVMGACFGFLPFNFNPAKIFMGDTGSMFLGYMLGVLSIQGAFKSYAVISFAVPILILGLPIFDAGFAILRRLFSGKGIMTADRGHLHHRLIDMGFSQKQSVFILYAVSGVLGITAVTLAESGALRALLLLICMLIFVFAGGFIATQHNEKVRMEKEKEEQCHEPDIQIASIHSIDSQMNEEDTMAENISKERAEEDPHEEN